MTVTEERPTAEIGQARRRKEDQRLITGRTKWTDNLTLPGMLHLAMVRTPVAHGTITSIDSSTFDIHVLLLASVRAVSYPSPAGSQTQAVTRP